MKQLTLFNNRPTLIQRVLSALLFHANTAPPIDRRRFYRIKNTILQRYGCIDGEKPLDWQDVSRKCWSCDGTGGLCEPGGCHKCVGSGVYLPLFVPLARWKIGGWLFHWPGETVRKLPEGVTIEVKGRINHAPSKHAFAAALALALIYDRQYARMLLREIPPLSWLTLCRMWLRSVRQRRTLRCIVCGRWLWFRQCYWGCCSEDCYRQEWLPF